MLSANPESTEEFRVITDNFNAEYGRNTGAIIDVVTKSGTNSFHGNVYYFGRWNGFGGARDYFNPGIGPNAGPMNPYIRHQFGFSIGGPIIKNKTFFFFNDEMDRFLTTLTNSASCRHRAFLTGQFNYNYIDTNGVYHANVPIDGIPRTGRWREQPVAEFPGGQLRGPRSLTQPCRRFSRLSHDPTLVQRNLGN